MVKNKSKIKYKIFGEKIDNQQIECRHKFSGKFMAIVGEYFKSLKGTKQYEIRKIIPSTFSMFWEDNNCVPFWNESKQKKSNEIFMPANYNLIKDNQLNDSFNKNKWFKSEFSKKLHNEVKDNPIKIEPVNTWGEVHKVVKIKLYCNPIQKQTLIRFMGVYRYFYNRTIEYSKNIDKTTKESYYYVDNKDKSTKKIVNLPKDWYSWYSLKKLLMKNKPEWVDVVGFDAHSCKQAIKEALIGIKANLKKGKKFTMKLKTKKDLVQTLVFEKQTINERLCTIMPNYKIDGECIFRNLKMSDEIAKYDYGGSTISYHRILKTMVLNLTYSVNKKKNINTKVVADDPGEKNFATLFSEDSVCKIGINCWEVIGKACKEVDIIQSRLDKGYYYKNDEKVIINANRRRNLKKAFHRKIQYIKDLRKELHNQTINYLVSNFGKIILPPFKTQEMVQRLSSKVARSMNTLAHYQFRLKLQNKCDSLNCQLIIKPEPYTSKTCTNCGNIKEDLGNSRIYSCTKCGIVLERDYNGARNIMLRNNWD